MIRLAFRQWPLKQSTGTIDGGQVPKEAMVRELHEETGYRYNDWNDFAGRRNERKPSLKI